MAFVPADNVAEIAMHVYHLNEDCVNVFHIKRTGLSMTVADLDALNALIKTWWIENVRGLVSASTVLWKLVATRLTVQNDVQRELFVTANDGTGTVSYPPMPGGTTCAISWRTANTGKSYRGRTYHIGLTQAAVDGNNLNSGTQTALNEAYADLPNAIHTDTFNTMVVLSRRSNGSARTAAVATPITSVIVGSSIDSQRRRLLGRGR